MIHVYVTVYSNGIILRSHAVEGPWKRVPQFDEVWSALGLDVVRETQGGVSVWRVANYWTYETLDVEFPTQEAAIVYAAMLVGGK